MVGLPDGVGLPVGGDSGYPFLVLMVHKNMNQRLESPDPLAVHFRLTGSREARVRPAHTISMSFWNTSIKPHTRRRFEAFYVVQKDVKLRPYQYYLHCHESSCHSEMWIVSRDSEWTMIGSQDGHPVQSFALHSVLTNVTVSHGDRIAVFCDLDNESSKVLPIGSESMLS